MLENGSISLDFEAQIQISHGTCVFIVGILNVFKIYSVYHLILNVSTLGQKKKKLCFW